MCRIFGGRPRRRCPASSRWRPTTGRRHGRRTQLPPRRGPHQRGQESRPGVLVTSWRLERAWDRWCSLLSARRGGSRYGAGRGSADRHAESGHRRRPPDESVEVASSQCCALWTGEHQRHGAWLDIGHQMLDHLNRDRRRRRHGANSGPRLWRPDNDSATRDFRVREVDPYPARIRAPGDPNRPRRAGRIKGGTARKPLPRTPPALADRRSGRRSSSLDGIRFIHLRERTGPSPSQSYRSVSASASKSKINSSAATVDARPARLNEAFTCRLGGMSRRFPFSRSATVKSCITGCLPHGLS